MLTIPDSIIKKQPRISRKFTDSSIDDTLRHLAFDNSLEANIISLVSTGKIIIANRSACKLLVYSTKGLLAKNRATIFDINENRFKIMLKQRTVEGHSIALVPY